MRNLDFQDIKIERPEEWAIPPLKLLRELQSAGSTDLSGFVPTTNLARNKLNTIPPEDLHDLNNFHITVFPRSRSNHMLLEHLIANDGQFRDITFGQGEIELIREFDSSIAPGWCGGRSIVHLGTKPADFYQQIDDLVGELGLQSQVAQFESVYFDDRPQSGEIRRWHLVLRDVYLRLRSVGYSHTELTE